MREDVDQIGIGERVRATRERLGLSREALAYHSGISWSAVAQVESGRRTNLRPTTLAALARTLKVTTDYLLSVHEASTQMLDHRALLYEDDDEFLNVAAGFLAEAVERSEPVLAFTSRARIEWLQSDLGSQAEEVHFVDQKEWHSTPVAALAAYREFVNQRLTGSAWVRILGDPVWPGRSQDDVQAWKRLESVLNLVFAYSPVTILCSYGTREVDPEILEAARATHPQVIEQGALRARETFADPGTFILDGQA